MRRFRGGSDNLRLSKLKFEVVQQTLLYGTFIDAFTIYIYLLFLLGGSTSTSS
jgi:hypothetical protein